MGQLPRRLGAQIGKDKKATVLYQEQRTFKKRNASPRIRRGRGKWGPVPTAMARGIVTVSARG